ALDYLVEFKAFAPGPIAEVIAGLEHAGLVTVGAVRSDVLAATTHAPLWRRALRRAQRLVDVRVAVPVDPLVTALDRAGGHVLYRRPVLWLLGLVALLGLGAFVSLAGVAT